jgi:sulfoxide reductase heme-binding subunit YedZ
MSPIALAANTAFGSNPLWYITRSTGLMAFVLLTASLALGVLTTQRVATPRWPRFASQALHRNVSLLAMLFLGTHVATTLMDSYVSISWWASLVPFASGYRTFDVALGTVAFDLLLLVTGSSLVRTVVGHRWWRLLHWCSYLAWPVALAHYLGTGTDARRPWSLGIALVTLSVVFAAVLLRLAIERREGPTRLLGSSR